MEHNLLWGIIALIKLKLNLKAPTNYLEQCILNEETVIRLF